MLGICPRLQVVVGSMLDVDKYLKWYAEEDHGNGLAPFFQMAIPNHPRLGDLNMWCPSLVCKCMQQKHWIGDVAECLDSSFLRLKFVRVKDRSEMGPRYVDRGCAAFTPRGAWGYCLPPCSLGMGYFEFW
jgi:hypothetical protein